MLDPVGAFGRIQDFFISYIETNFRISDKEAAKSRRNLLLAPNVMATSAFIEPVLRYKPSPDRLEDLVGKPGSYIESLSLAGQKAFVELALSGLFDGKPAVGDLKRQSSYEPYLHQVQMLDRGLKAGHPGIVTSGTGSGKTESFMLPVLAAIANEAVDWAKPSSDYLKNDWWLVKGSQWSPRRAGEKRPAAMRALVLYPMNALVEDQMVRLRKTLDSDDARAVMDDRFNENRIFFGQYTSATPVTGYEHHPRMAKDEKEKGRRSRRVRKLRLALQEYDKDQTAARKFDAVSAIKAAERGAPAPDKTRYIFPSLDGGEMLSRWDMHVSPPDVLVTNASMLGAMLSREVEDPIFEETRKWLVSDQDAYFYLIFDELHLIRGSSGTEIAFLIKSLIQRLGLDAVEHRSKLRILASSASLPTEGDAGIQSMNYLRDLFAPYGTSKTRTDEGSTEPDFWRDCVVKGVPNIPTATLASLPAAPFEKLLKSALKPNSNFVASVEPNSKFSAALIDVANAFNIKASGEADLVKRVAETAAALLTSACKDGDGVRATSAEVMASKIFTASPEPIGALRGLFLARALPETGKWPGVKVAPDTPSFRVHTFIRNVEGLFAAPKLAPSGLSFSDLTIERGTSHAPKKAGQKRGARLFELLYCEACGDLFIGGQRGQKSATHRATELLPSAADLENIPERAGAEYYDNMTLDEFAVFWPRLNAPLGPEKDYDKWEPAHLDPVSGVVSKDRSVPDGHIGGHLYFQNEAAAGKGKTRTAQPFCCPKCGTDYSNRPASNRSRTPIRAFRTGVSKASQLVATELFELLHAIGAEPKGIVFSDSRQDAANQALEIERLHLRDLRREVLVTAARALQKKNSTTWITLSQVTAALEADAAEGEKLMDLYSDQKKKFGTSPPGQKVKLDRLLESGDSDASVGDLVSEFVKMGVHPFDETGLAGYDKYPWTDLFQINDGSVQYSSNLSSATQKQLSGKILERQYELIDDVIFANTFFALEETGLAYPSAAPGPENDTAGIDAWLRVFASATRVTNNKYHDTNKSTDWEKGSDVTNNRVKKFARRIFGELGFEDGLTGVLDQFDKLGHKHGRFEIGHLYLRVSNEDDSYWRCGKCERVHLHLGLKFCTRCAEALPDVRTGIASDLWRDNFLGRRIVRGNDEGVGRFRLRVEELTGQTDNFSDRLRKFKGIFVDGESQIQRLSSEIDMLSVTTTMEVGIDIGSLQTVYQANMPPQRFNYQQRVGRAGRRGQAFSFVVTFCRGRSHDAYYFAHPEAITGDAPPPPFLAINHDPIPLRLLRKAWLRAAFSVLREECAEAGQDYPGDMLVPPDVHGEYVTTRDYFYDTGGDWPARLRSALDQTLEVRNSYAKVATFDADQRDRLLDKATIDQLLADIDALKPYAPKTEFGMARFLAEWGLLPMYGMPTRVRQLYLGVRADDDGPNPDYEWSTMDRDLDLAVFEFAPGSILVKDKQKHSVIGFSGDLAEPQINGRSIKLRTVSSWEESSTYVAMCPSCGSAKHHETHPETVQTCEDCSSDIGIEEFKLYITPAAFRTDFEPKTDTDEAGRMAVRTVATVLNEGEKVDCGPLAVRRGANVTIMQLNDGVSGEDGIGEQFTVEEAVDQRAQTPLGSSQIDGTQAIELSYLEKQKSNRWLVAPGSQKQFGLIARKKTDVIYLELQSFDHRLNLALVARKGVNSNLPTRAAAISATQILIQRAALELDVSADEFEALEPRLRASSPMLQIADSLINGSGLCRRLGEQISKDRQPLLAEMIFSVVNDADKWPLKDFLASDADGNHAQQCQTSCYRCIQRFGNRRYHGLLDWRLGLAYLRALVTPNYTCGISPAEKGLPEIADWNVRAHELAETVASMRSGTLTYRVLPASGLPSIVEKTHDGQQIGHFVVIHPLWKRDRDVMSEVLGPDWSGDLHFLDTFNLERRPLRALANVKSKDD